MIGEKIRADAKKAFREKGLKCVIGYSNEGVPFFAENEQEVDLLSFNAFCSRNLVGYIKAELTPGKGEKKKPVGIVVKGCDSKALLLLLNENIISREDIFIIGVPCTGVIDSHVIERLLRKKGCSVRPNTYVVTGDNLSCRCGNDMLEIPFADTLYKRCVRCSMRNPIVYDVLASDFVKEDKKDYSEIEAIEKMTSQERWKFWERIFADCIRCHACKRSCPVCYCDECLLDPTEIVVRMDTTAEEKAFRPKWVEKSNTVTENIIYHLARLPHLIGRCVDCGECERVCPKRLPLRFLTMKLEKDVSRVFKYEAAQEQGQKPLIALSDMDDENGFIM